MPTPASVAIVHASRVDSLTAGPIRVDGDYVLYWMTAQRRTAWNHALDRAVAWCRALGRPLLVFEPLRCDYPWAAARHHQFVVEGMRDNAAALAEAGVGYFPYVEPAVGGGRGLLAALAARACVVVADTFPAFFLPAMVAAAARQLANVRAEVVDSNGALPLALSGRAFPTAAAFRWHLHRTVWPQLALLPEAAPLAEPVLRGAAPPADVLARWPAVDLAPPAGKIVASVPVSAVPAAGALRGGRVAGLAAARAFLSDRMSRYATDRNQIDGTAASGLSPYLHFGHVGAVEIVAAVMEREGITPASSPAPRATGARAGWWGASAGAEAFLDELITWRELGFVSSAHGPTDYDALPPWARATLDAHAGDARPWRYTLDELDSSATHDPIWNAAQTELREDGTMHNYLRMLWGKKVLEWAPSPRVAFDWLVALNNRYALDGRDPNSYTGISWVFGRYDRPWGPERPIFGTIRYMSSDSTRRKLDLGGYLSRYGGEASVGQQALFR